jgi:hypothetical protein
MPQRSVNFVHLPNLVFICLYNDHRRLRTIRGMYRLIFLMGNIPLLIPWRAYRLRPNFAAAKKSVLVALCRDKEAKSTRVSLLV